MERPKPNRRRLRTPPPLQVREVREILSLALLAFACGTAMREPAAGTRGAPPTQMATLGHPPRTVQSADAEAAFATLVARGAVVAPGMREVTRAASGDGRHGAVEVARAEGRDACIRVAFTASSPVVGKLMDGDGNVLAMSDAPTMDGVLGEHGPVCVRKGDAVSAIAEGPGASVRWVAWVSP
jgi:hypothetical protein